MTVIKTESGDIDAVDTDDVFDDNEFVPDLTNVEDLDDVPLTRRRGRRKRRSLVRHHRTCQLLWSRIQNHNGSTTSSSISKRITTFNYMLARELSQ